jgi:D-xylose reductase
MEELVDEGLVKNIGIRHVSISFSPSGNANSSPFSNFQGSLILDILRYARIEPQVHQMELHPYLTQEPLLKLMNVFGIAVTGYSSFGPQSYLELGWHQNVPSLLEHDQVRSIAEAKGKCTRTRVHCRIWTKYVCSAATAQVLLRWATQRKIAVIPKTNIWDRMVSNLECNTFDLSEVETQQLSALNVNLKVRQGSIHPFFLALIVISKLNNPADIDPRVGVFA